MNLDIPDNKKDGGGEEEFFQRKELLKSFRLEKQERDRCDDTEQGCISKKHVFIPLKIRHLQRNVFFFTVFLKSAQIYDYLCSGNRKK